MQLVTMSKFECQAVKVKPVRVSHSPLTPQRALCPGVHYFTHLLCGNILFASGCSVFVYFCCIVRLYHGVRAFSHFKRDD
jgi:hypothetical protein